MVDSSFLYMVRCFITVTEQSRVDTVHAWGVGVARLCGRGAALILIAPTHERVGEEAPSGEQPLGGSDGKVLWMPVGICLML